MSAVAAVAVALFTLFVPSCSKIERWECPTENHKTITAPNAEIGRYPKAARQRRPESVNLDTSDRSHNASGATSGHKFISPTDTRTTALRTRRGMNMSKNYETNENAEMFALAKRHGRMDLYERAITGGLNLELFREEILNARASAPIPGISDTADYRGGSVGGVREITGGGQWRTRSRGGFQSIGSRFVQSEHCRAENKRGKKRTILFDAPDLDSFSQSRIEIEREYLYRASNPLNSATEGLTAIGRVPQIQILDQQPLRVAQLFAESNTDQATIRYIAEESYTQAATAVAEGAAKPGASLDLSEVDATVRKIAVYTKVTDEMASDFNAVQTYINNRLAYMVGALEDSHLLNGSGSANQIKGVLNFTGIQTVAGVLNPMDAILKAINYVRGANGSGFLEPDAVIVHPLDWLNMKLTKDANGQYLGGGPFSAQYSGGPYSNVGTIWGLPAIITNSIAQGTALTGAFRTAAQIHRRMGITVEMTNTDQDDFIKNLMTIRAELRLALTVYKSAGFCQITGIPQGV